MIRISTIFIAICMVLVAASLGFVLYSVAGISGSESAIVALTALTCLILYNAVSMRLRDRSDVGGQIADLSRGTADLARQVAEFGRRLAAVEGRVASANSTGADRMQGMAGEINELGGLVRQLAASVAHHEDLLAATPAVQPVAAPLDDLLQPAAPAPTVMFAPAPPPAPAPAISRSQSQLVGAIKQAIDANRLDIYLQPMVTLPQRKVRYYEAVTRLRDERDQVLAADDFIEAAEAAGLIGRIDHMVMLRCVQVLRRLMIRSKDVGVFCNVSASTLASPTHFTQCLDFLEANRALAPSFVLEFKQATFRHLGPVESENLAALAQRGFRFSIDHVSDLRLEPRELADRGVRFIKVPAALLLDANRSATSDIHPSDLSDLLGRFGIDLIAERIEGERSVVDLLDYDVRFGQGFLFAPPRPLRPEGASATAEAPQANPQDLNGASTSAPVSSPAAPPRATGSAALARRALGPN
ncbi:EAL domain-containing protein [Bradyrhizobium tropiciagri]|uniref:EAL domain-containing protein n=1 Tax=Bradyrhizobium tropiciagri TaxID=312253 RepID=UPI001BAD4E85|nr:EAL domain-containing protein [Bradyrhizobium tropiciagri]MBR0893588.1 EAL domain-containing protein [Bradyrhizobium tropiciagri]